MRLLLSFFMLLSWATVFAQSADEKAVLAAEKARFDAQVAKDYDALGKLLTDDLVYTHSNGNVDGKESFIQSIKDGKSSYNTIDVKEQKVRVYGNTAIINGRCDIKMNAPDGKLTDLRLRYTDVYVKRNGRWQMATWQSLRLAQ
ncbi:nuclear transport factor 2 family protein [Rudanella paleaurantiibacter]|nr:nuclear transport factor 2 family protein [Rudanella paleaurantiibacter]